MEEEFSDSESEDNKQTPTNSDDQVNTQGACNLSNGNINK